MPTGLVSFASLAVAAAGLTAIPSRVQACSVPSSAVEVYTLPVDGDTEVPLNAQVLVSYFIETRECAAYDCDDSVLADVVLRAEDGTEVPVTVETHLGFEVPIRWLRIVPVADLAPFTRYEVLHRIDSDCLYPCILSEPAVGATFETGADIDTTAPVFDGLGSFAGGPSWGDSDASCGYYTGVRFTLYWDAASDERAVAYRVAGAIVLPSPFDTSIDGFVPCTGLPMVLMGILDYRGPFHVTAVDLAGNEDDNDVEMYVDTPCTAIPVFDAGTPAVDAGSPDAGTPVGDGAAGSSDGGARVVDAPRADAASDPQIGGGGCACTTASAPFGAAPTLVLLALLRPRSRRIGLSSRRAASSAPNARRPV